MSNIARALNIARRAARRYGGRSPMQTGGTDQQQPPETSQAASNSYLPAMTQPMGANTADYARMQGYNAASSLQQGDWSGAMAQNQSGQGAQQPPTQNQPVPATIQSGPAPPVGQPTPAPTPSTTSVGQPAANIASQLSPNLMRALKLSTDYSQPAQPTAGAKPVINAGGKNTVSQPGQVDASGNENEAPSSRRVQDALKNTSDIAGLTDTIRQKKIQNVQQNDPVGNFIRNLMSGQQQKQQAQPQQPNQPPAMLSPQSVKGKPATPPQAQTQPLPNLENAKPAQTQPIGAPQAKPQAAAQPTPQPYKAKPFPYTMEQMAKQSGEPQDQIDRLQSFGGNLTPKEWMQQYGSKYWYFMPADAQKKIQAAYNQQIQFEKDEAQKQREGITAPAAQAAEQKGQQAPTGVNTKYGSLIPPVENFKLGSRLGEGRNHQGNDLVVPEGTPFRAPSSGVILRHNEHGSKQGDAFTIMRGDNGLTYGFGHHHLDPNIKPGDHIEAGQVLGTTGVANNVPHLHFETWAGADRGNPQYLLDPAQVYGWADDKNVARAGPSDVVHTAQASPSGGIPGERSTTGSAGTGTPEQEAKAKNLRFQSWWREIWSGQANPMLPYERESAEMNLKNVWSDYDTRRQFQYGTASPPEGARAAVDKENSELAAHKALDSAVKNIQSERGETHPGGHTLSPGTAAAGRASDTAQQAREAWNNLPDEAKNVANAWGVQAQMFRDAARYRASGSPQNVAIASGLEAKAVEMQGRLIQEAAETGKVNTQRLREGILPYGNLGYFDLNHLDANGRPSFHPNVELARQNYEFLKNQEQGRQGQQSPAATPSPSIGGTGVPDIGKQLPTQPTPLQAPNVAAPPQAGSTKNNRPIPASPSTETEERRKQGQVPFAGPDYINAPRVATPPASEAYNTEGRFSQWGPSGEFIGNKEHDDKFAEDARTRAAASSRASVLLESIVTEAGKLKPGEAGPEAHEVQERAGQWNQFAGLLERSTGLQLKRLPTNAAVDVIELQALEIAREIATGQGSSGRGAGRIMGMLMPHMPTGKLPEEPDAIPRVAAALKAEAARNQDYADGIADFMSRGLSLRDYDRWFDENHPIEGYVGRGEIWGSRNEHRRPITNEDVQYLREHPESEEGFRRAFKLSPHAMRELKRGE